MTQRIMTIFTLIAFTALLLVGCGGGNNALSSDPSAGNTAKAMVTIKWPVATRLIPVASNSIKITITKTGGFSSSQTVTRPTNEPPTSVVTFTELPTGNYSVTATAYPLVNATGIAQATATAPLVVTSAETVLLTITMGSTITDVPVTPVTPTVLRGGTVQLTGTPENIANEMVLVAVGNITWTSSDVTVATVNASTGLVTAVKAGNAIITATESDSHASGSTVVTVPEVIVTISPKTATLFATTTRQFTTNVTGAANTTVTWIVMENGGGTVSPTGLYTAPLTPGAYHIRATSTDDSTKWDTATVTVIHLGPAPIDLQSAGNFAIIAGSTVTNTGPTSITGNLGLSPGGAVTGFPPGTVIGSIQISNPTAAAAKLDLTTAYLDAAGRSLDVIVMPTNELGALTLEPGLYQSSSSFAITSVDLTLDAKGDPSAVWIFQMPSTLTVGSGCRVILTNGAQADNIYWQVGSSATLGTTSFVSGNILAQASITLQTGTTLNGRALTQIGAVTLDANTVTKP